jgi:PWWP domain
MAIGVDNEKISVGDFVWAKVKGYNWWPAEVSYSFTFTELSCSNIRDIGPRNQIADAVYRVIHLSSLIRECHTWLD